MDRETFRNPPMDCRAAPFWSWNGQLDVEETRWQVREMVEHGMGGGFMHARSGLRTEYLGEEWFANVVASIEEGKKVGFSSWIYDEDRWPSGACGGRTAATNPDFRARVVVMQRGADMPPSDAARYAELTPLARFRAISAPGAQPSFVPAAPDERGPEVVAFYAGVVPPRGMANDGFYPDLMNEQAVREFINNTHEAYASRCASEFGKAVPGVFTDEPCLLGPVPWSVRLPDEFRRRRGYDLIPNLPALFFSTSDAPRVRHDFWKTVYELFNENFVGQIGDWCRKHGLLLTGHLLAEEQLGSQIRTAGGMMWHYIHMGAPGIDILREQLVEVITCKQVSSICNQFDRKLMLSELYGCTGYDFSFEGQKWVGDWQMALGVNLLCPHLTLYTMKGCAKRDYPPSYFYQSPWWRHYRYIADYQARLCYVLRQGRPVRDILLLHPLTGAWCSYDPNASAQGLSGQDELFKRIMNDLLCLHRDFDLGDEMVLARHGAVDGSAMVVGSARYRLVVVPPTCNLESSTLDLLEKYVAAGGKLVFMRPLPTLVDGVASDRPTRLAHAPGVVRMGRSRRELSQVLDALLPRAVSVVNAETGMEARQVLCQHRKDGEQHIFFLANTDREACARLKLRVPLSGGWQEWDCETGRVAECGSREDAGWSEVELALAPVGSAVFVLNPTAKPAVVPTIKARITRRPLNQAGTWKFHRLAPNSLVLDRCTYRINDEPFSQENFLIAAQEEWRRRLGLFSAVAVNRGPQPWVLLKNPENLKPRGSLTLRYRFQVEALPSAEAWLVLEDRAETQIFVNGTPVTAPSNGWFMDKAFEKVPIGKHLKNGENVIELRATLTAMRIMEDIYLVGDFGVDCRTFAITREPNRLLTGDWRSQGYPFYTDAMVYETAFTVPKGFDGAVRVELERFEGTAAALWINGEKAAVIGWRPYAADVTRFVRPGKNTLGIEIVGSPRNLMGPRHNGERYPLWTGPSELAETVEPTYHMSPAGLTGPVTLALVRTR